jgi:uncharacterized low-complexity protein
MLSSGYSYERKILAINWLIAEIYLGLSRSCLSGQDKPGNNQQQLRNTFMTTINRKVATAVGVFVLGSLSSVGVAQANAFSATELSGGYQLAAAEAACGADKAKTTADKAKEAKCGADKAKATADKAKEGKCGEGKCGADKAKAAADKAKEAKCGADKAKATADKAKEGKCGEGKCGEGKCGGMN